ncbi:FAD-linked oxidase [Aquimarina brevivitae]|uniref:FAD binding domain-containing protein n=1 Tax=Aquimarina brevivitae TaxID=323412 RepID=A0A4Q7P1Z0_9FLAO|nr:FAD-linked oxidase [Aquimarina brevivitae]RZS93886.1 hypothetical protein EV197_2467 [Aquimarina brevivitae]
MAHTTTYAKTSWDTLHNNGPFPLKYLQITELESNSTLPNAIARYNDATLEIQQLIQQALAHNQGFRAYGSRWSMSSIAHQKDRLHYNGYMNLDIPIPVDAVRSDSPYQVENLFFFQCGNTIKEISQKLSQSGKSLKTSGASNGQTIAGCISTGVHGSALDVGAIQDYVVGIQLITGPKAKDVLYLERHTKPALTSAFVHQLNATVIRNDELFNAALVSLGSFGFIHGVVIEAEDRFLLHRYVRKVDKQLALSLADTMDFSSQVLIPEAVDRNGKPLRPYHYKVFINQYVNDPQYVIEVMYKKPYVTPYPDPFTIINKSLYRDLIHLLIKISEKYPKTIPWFIKKLEKQILPDVNEETLGTLYETFWDAPYQGPAFACSFGVDHKDSSKVLELLTKTTLQEGPIPGIFAMRFVKGGKATLGFTKFPITCVIEIDGVLWQKTNKLISLKEYSNKMITVLQQHNIDFTLHWGKNADWSYPGLINYMYSAKAEEWKKFRTALLRPELARVFSNHFLESTKLSDSVSVVPQDLIVSL